MNKIVLTLKKERTWKVLICYFVIFLFPVFLGKNFIITGTIVNCFLIFGALNFKKYEILPMIFLPSIGKFLGGKLFLMTMPVALFLPFIWIGNFALVALFRILYLKKRRSYIETLMLAGMAKIGVLSIFPASLSWFTDFGDMSHYPLLALSIGFLQGITILGGGILAAILNKAKVMKE
jgi:hypothetical protein